MKSINTKGITYLEKLEGATKWYWGTDYIHGDLYEAEELFNNNYGSDFQGWQIIMVNIHYKYYNDLLSNI